MRSMSVAATMFAILVGVLIALALHGCAAVPDKNLVGWWHWGCNEGYASDCADLRNFMGESAHARDGFPVPPEVDDEPVSGSHVYSRPACPQCGETPEDLPATESCRA